MPVLDQTTSNSFTGNGVTTVFAYSYKILAEADLLVEVDGVAKTLTTHYTVSGVGNSGGGNVTFLTAPALDAIVVVSRDMDYARATDYQENGDLLAATLDEDVDRVTMLVQQVRQLIRRAVKLPTGVTTDQVLPTGNTVAERASKIIGFDAAGDPALLAAADVDLATVSAFILTLLDDADAAAARATLGALGTAGGNLTGGINSARGNITQHATTMDFFAVASPDILDGTGSAVTITACTNAPQAGAVRKFYPIVATVLTHGATFDIAGNANLTAAAGDCWIIEAKTASTYRVTAVKETGLPVAFIDEDSMASDSAVLVPSQQSVKAYVDAQASAGITLGTPVASTSGTSIDFTSIPAGTKRITVMFDGVSTNGTSPVQVQIGDSGGIEATGYLGASSRSGSVSAANNSAGFLLEDGGSGTVVRHGSLTLSLLSSSANIWTANGNVGRSDSANIWSQGGSKPLSATLDRVRITTVGGTDTFDAGTINIAYE
jgi:hypothetical protein